MRFSVHWLAAQWCVFTKTCPPKICVWSWHYNLFFLLKSLFAIVYKNVSGLSCFGLSPWMNIEQQIRFGTLVAALLLLRRLQFTQIKIHNTTPLDPWELMIFWKKHTDSNAFYRTWKVEVIKNKKGAGQDFLEMDLCVQAHAAAALLFVEGRLSKQLVITTNQAKLLYYLESTLVQ